MGLISKYILPEQVDFDAALSLQAQASRIIVDELYKACVESDKVALHNLPKHAERARVLKSKNMTELLAVFITPYDKESIYRIITQLDWITLSVKHFMLEFDAYFCTGLMQYQEIFETLKSMAEELEASMAQLAGKKGAKFIAARIDKIHDQYDDVVELCASAMSDLLKTDDIKQILIHKDLLSQLKEIAKRIHVSANTLEDMAIKLA